MKNIMRSAMVLCLTAVMFSLVGFNSFVYSQSALIAQGNATGTLTGSINYFSGGWDYDDDRIYYVVSGAGETIPFNAIPSMNTSSLRLKRFMYIPASSTGQINFTLQLNTGWNNHSGLKFQVTKSSVARSTSSLLYYKHTPPDLHAMRGDIMRAYEVPAGVGSFSSPNLSLNLSGGSGMNVQDLAAGIMDARPRYHIYPSSKSVTDNIGTITSNYSIPYQVYEPFIEKIEITDEGYVRMTINSGVNVQTGIERLINPSAATLVRISNTGGKVVYEDRSPQLGTSNEYEIFLRSDIHSTGAITRTDFNYPSDLWRVSLKPKIYVSSDPVGQREIMEQLAMITTKIEQSNSTNYSSDFSDLQTSLTSIRNDLDSAGSIELPDYGDDFVALSERLDRQDKQMVNMILQNAKLQKETPSQKATSGSSVRLKVAVPQGVGVPLYANISGAWIEITGDYFDYPLSAGSGLKSITVEVSDLNGNNVVLTDNIWKLP